MLEKIRNNDLSVVQDIKAKILEKLDIKYELSNKVNESSLSRLWKHSTTHDTGTISAFRYARDCNTGERYTKSENLNRSKILKAKLLKLGYGVTKIAGTYIENYKTANAKEVDEESYFVVDLKDSKSLKRDLITLGTEFEQDSITYSKPSGEYYLISSSKCPDGHPGNGKIGVEIRLGKAIFGEKGEFHSKINGRPFVFNKLVESLEVLTDFDISAIRSISEFAKVKID